MMWTVLARTSLLALAALACGVRDASASPPSREREAKKPDGRLAAACSTTPRDVVVALDASTWVDENFFYGPVLDLAERLMLEVDGAKGGRVALVAFNRELTTLLPLRAHPIAAVEDAVFQIREDRSVSFSCCRPYALVLADARAKLVAPAPEGGLRQPVLIVIGGGRPLQNMVLPEAASSLTSQNMHRDFYLARQVPNMAAKLKKDLGAIVAFVGVPSRRGAAPEVGYFTDADVSRRYCGKAQSRCFRHDKAVVSRPYAAHAIAVDFLEAEDAVENGAYDEQMDAAGDKISALLCRARKPEPEPALETAAPPPAPQNGNPAQNGNDTPNGGGDVEALLPPLDLPATNVGVLGSEPRDLVIVVDASSGVDKAMLTEQLVPLVLQVARTVEPAEFSQVGVVFYDSVVRNAGSAPGVVPLRARPFTALEQLVRRAATRLPCCRSPHSALAEALREARRQLAESKFEFNEKMVLVVTASNALKSEHWRAHVAGMDPARYLARTVPLEARSARRAGVRVMLAAGPDARGDAAVNRAYFEGSIAADYSFCHDGACYAYRGQVVSNPVQHNVVVAGSWALDDVFPKVAAMLAHAAPPTPSPSDEAPPGPPGNAGNPPGNPQGNPSEAVHVFLLVDDAVSAAVFARQMHMLEALLHLGLDDGDDNAQVSYTYSLATSSCQHGARTLLSEGDADEMDTLVQELLAAPPTLALDHFTCALPGLLQLQADIGPAEKLVTVLVTGPFGASQDATSAAHYAASALRHSNHLMLSLVPSSRNVEVEVLDRLAGHSGRSFGLAQQQEAADLIAGFLA